MSELPAHLADGWHLLCQARDYIRAGGNKGLGLGGAFASPLHIFADQLNLYQLCMGGADYARRYTTCPPDFQTFRRLCNTICRFGSLNSSSTVLHM